MPVFLEQNRAFFNRSEDGQCLVKRTHTDRFRKGWTAPCKVQNFDPIQLVFYLTTSSDNPDRVPLTRLIHLFHRGVRR